MQGLHEIHGLRHGALVGRLALRARDGDGTQRRLTDLHGALLAERAVITPEAIEYVAPDGLPVQGWVLYPRDFDPQGRAPLVDLTKRRTA